MRPGRPTTLARVYLHRLAALYGVLLLVSVGAAMTFVMWPMGQRAADDLAALMHLSAQTWVELPPGTRPAFEDELRRAHRLALRPDPPAAEPAAHWHGFYLLFLERALQQRQGRPVSLERLPGPDAGEWLWARLSVGGRDIGVGFDYARLATRPLVALAAMLVAAAALLGLASVWLARRIAEPIERLEAAAEQLARGANPRPLPEDGPIELARLAGHFNHLAGRVHELLAGRTTLLAGISHDLRTPLARMRLALEMLRLAPEPRLVDRLDADVDAMNALIGRMLDLARGLDAEPLQPVALTEWLRGRVEAHRPAAERIGATLDVHGPAGLQVEAPVGLLGRVLDNLVENALRYAPGPIEVAARRDDASADTTIEVADRGPGIPEDELEAALRPFHRIETSRSPRTGGYGLGLAVVRQIAASQGWALRLANRPGGGLLVRITIPRRNG